MRYDSVIYHACKDVSSENTAENGEKEVNILHKNTPVTVYAAPVFAVNAGQVYNNTIILYSGREELSTGELVLTIRPFSSIIILMGIL